MFFDLFNEIKTCTRLDFFAFKFMFLYDNIQTSNTEMSSTFSSVSKLKQASLTVLHYRLDRSCFISFPSVHTSLIIFHFYFLHRTVHLSYFIYHSASCLCLPYLVALILHGHSTLLSISLFSQSRLWKLTTYECL